jgi:hypothetical protein
VGESGKTLGNTMAVLLSILRNGKGSEGYACPGVMMH